MLIPLQYTQLIAQFIQYVQLEKRYSPHTVTGYQNDLEQFFTYIYSSYSDINDIKQINTSIVRSWLATIKNDEQLAATTINRKISTLKSFYKYLLKKSIVNNNPLYSIVTQKASKKLPSFLTEEAVEKLQLNTALLAEQEPSWTNLTEHIIINLLYQTGMRRAELLNLSIDKIDFYNNQIKILGKGNKERLIPIANHLANLLKNYISKRPETQVANLLIDEQGQPLHEKKLYQIVKKQLSAVTTQNKKSPHILRHSFATHTLNNGADINAVKELLGHSSLAATQVYTHTTIAQLKAIHKQAHPKGGE